MEGLENAKEKLKMTLLQGSVETSKSPEVKTLGSPDVKKSISQDVMTPAKAVRHKTTLYLTERQYKILEKMHYKRKLEGKSCDRYAIVGEAIEITYGEEAEEDESI